MARFTLPRDLYHGKGALEALKTFEGKKAIICVGGGSMKRFGFLDRAKQYLEEAGMEVQLFEGIEPDPSVETVMKGAKAMEEFGPDWIVAIGGGSPIDAAKAMWIKYEYPDITFEDMCKVFGIPKLRKKAHFCAISSTSGTATEVTAFSIITDYEKGIKYPIADFEITPDVAIVDPELAETMPQKLVALFMTEQKQRRKPRKYTDEFKQQLVELYRSGKRRCDICREYDIATSLFDKWVKQASNSGSFHEKDNRTPEQEELIRLRKENQQLRMENDILKQAALILGRK